MSAPAFTFRDCVTTRGLISSGEGSAEFYHPILPMPLATSAGFLLQLNGWNLNRAQSDIVGHDGTTTTALHMLQMRAPREPVAPLISAMGDGRVYRPGAKYRYRWKNSRTGQHSGLSPIPIEGINLGMLAIAGGTTYVGQQTWFYIPTAGKPAHADTIEMFANTTEQDNVWYLTDSKPTGSSSYVLLNDNKTDEELLFQLAVVTGSPSGIPAGPTWSEGIMWPVVKSWRHPSNRMFYFGIRRFGVWGPDQATVAVTQGSDLVTISDISGQRIAIEPGRVGQRIKFQTSTSASTLIRDPTVYRIIKMESANTFRVWPELQVSPDLALGASTTFSYVIEDDRDSRFTFISEPNKPWLLDPLKIIAAGDDYDDGVLHWFTVQGRIFIQTKRRIYEAVGSETDNPATSTLFIPILDEGTVGFWSGCEALGGWVYVHEELGVRFFNGQYSTPLDGFGDPYKEFLPKTQFENFEPSMLEEVRVIWDKDEHEVIVAYAPLGQGTLKESLVFSCAERVWRGPNRECHFSSGKMRSSASSDVLVVGDPFGELLVRNTQDLDVMPSLSGSGGTGSITSVQTHRVFTDSAAFFNLDSDERLRGSPIWFYDNTYYYFARIADVLSGTQLELDGRPIREDGTITSPTVAWTYGIGSIRWSGTTSYIDAENDPSKPFIARRVLTRHLRGVDSEVYEIAASENANGTFSGVRQTAASAPADTRNVTTGSKVHGELRLMREGALVQIRARGTARSGDPQIGRIKLAAADNGGALQ